MNKIPIWIIKPKGYTDEDEFFDQNDTLKDGREIHFNLDMKKNSFMCPITLCNNSFDKQYA
jgi:hypothetical protein